ncbi:MAG: hypothetical protein ABIA37_02490, partial [Candidatus Woesearchaeota archaeon]
MLDETIYLALETIRMKKQALVFVPSRASAEKTAEDISNQTKLMFPELANQILKVSSTPTKQCRRLANCIKKGIAFHHAGLCLPPGTEIILANGQTKRIEEVVTNFKREEKSEIMTLDLATLKIKTKEIAGVFEMDVNEPLVRIKTRLGKQLTLTQEHLLLTIDEQSTLRWKKAKDFRTNEYLASTRRLNIKKDDVPTTINLLRESVYVYNIKDIIKQYVREKKIKQKLSKLSRKILSKDTNINLRSLREINKELGNCLDLSNLVKIVHCNRGKKTFIPRTIPAEFLRFVGIIVADGHLSKTGSITLELTDLELIEECEKIIRGSFSIDCQT